MTVLPGRPVLRPAHHRPCAALAVFLTVALLAAPGVGAPQDEQTETSLIKPLASRSLLLDAAAAGGTMMVVGERGHVLVSRDEGASWTQVAVPTRSTLTGVFLHDDQLGWVVGHDAVILRTRDGGNSWERLFWAPEQERPLFDVWFRDAENGFAIGAYGFFLETDDGGDSWTERAIVDPDELDEEYDPFAFTSAADVHLNKIADAGSGRLYVTAEAGLSFRSDDAGRTWESLEPPYQGSFFGSLPLGGDSVLLFGLRGHLFRSDDAGATWRPIETGTVALLTDGVRLADGTVVVTGLAGTLLVSGDGGETFRLVQQPDRQGLATLLPTANGNLVLVGEYGVNTLSADALGIR